MINLDSIVFDEDFKTSQLFEKIDQVQIYSRYIGEQVKPGESISSPFREDSVPSFSFFYHKNKHDTLMFYDFAVGVSGDAIRFVGIMYNVSYMEAAIKIANDFGLSSFDSKNEKAVVGAITHKEKKKVDLQILKRKWNSQDRDFWQVFGITKKTLEKFNVFPISHIFYNGVAVKAESLSYCYMEKKDGTITFKIYQPLSKTFKWINNSNYSVHQGYTQLPDGDELLIVTKSLKDVMSLHDTANINAIGLQSESVMMKLEVMDEYKSRFDLVICLFDNDKAGKKLTTKFTKMFNIPSFFMPEIGGVTDYSDMVKYSGVKKSITFLTEKINEIKK